MPMIVTAEFDNQVASCVSASKARNTHCGFCTGRNKAHLLDCRHEFCHFCCQKAFDLRCDAEGGSLFNTALHRFKNRRVCMAIDKSAPGSAIVNIMICICIC